MADVLWRPSEAAMRQTRMTMFTDWLRQRTGRDFPDYVMLHQWSVEHLEEFWEAFLEFTGLITHAPHRQVLDRRVMPGGHWFSGMQLNFAENILARGFSGPAIVSCVEPALGASEGGGLYGRAYSYKQLRDLVARCARGLRAAGIGPGDRVAGYVANVPEAIVACLACVSLGAIWSSASPDFGLAALCDRFSQVEPKLVFASTHYRYNGRTFTTEAVVKALHHNLPSVQTIVSIPYPAGEAHIHGDVAWENFLGADAPPELAFTPVPFEHPLYILFSSGTTGAPKCIMHGTGGTLLQHRKEQELHTDLRPGDSLLYFTTCGWMMWNWQLTALSLGVTLFLYDGNPGFPDVPALWRIVEALGITHFGTSGRYIESCMKHQPAVQPGSLGSMSKLRTVLYTGSPLSASGYRWIYETIKPDVHLAGICGGTDIISCFMLGHPNLPVIAGEIQCKGLGVDVVAFDEEGKPVVGKPGELVCRQPLPCLPLGFLNDPDGSRYYHTYFDVYPGLWRHGDYVEFTPNGGVIVYGRSDATLNPAGVRIGSAEIYAVLDSLSEVSGAVVVGWKPPEQSDEVIVLCVVLAPGHHLDAALAQKIRHMIREQTSPRHVPHHLFPISEVPVTRSGKPVELSVKAILGGQEVSNREALANPHVLEEFGQIRQELLQRYTPETPVSTASQ
ncbi:MAG TPA: acetoacetate--CoA ligase [Candidatus Tectomicrobia bacterium]|nr:acetoacetate--CoA ligase [Candidatus Tectomicrobia bacterium]